MQFVIATVVALGFDRPLQRRQKRVSHHAGCPNSSVRLRLPASPVTPVPSQPAVSGHPSKPCRELPLFLTVTASTKCYQPSPACWYPLPATRMEEQAARYVPPNWRNVAAVSTSRALRELPHGARAARRSPLLAITPLEAFQAPAPAWGTLSPNTPWRLQGIEARPRR
jgi:hypothetical protein